MGIQTVCFRILMLWGSTFGVTSGNPSLRSTRQLISYDDAYWPRYEGYACRTSSGSHGNDGEEYVVYEYKSLSWCKEKCYSLDACEAFEYEVDGSYYKCEIWYERPGDFSSNEGHRCWIKGEEVTNVNADYTMVDGNACRTGDGRTGSHGQEYYRYSNKSLAWCTDTCTAQQDCKGFEYKATGTTHCELWMEEPENFKEKSGMSCYVKIH